MTARRFVGIALVGLGLAAVPFLTDSNLVLNFLITTLMVALLGQAWNVLGGYCGQFSFGHAVFFGTGAYASAILQVRFGINPWVALPLAMAAGALVGAFIGALSFRFRLRGSYFALITLAFAEVARILASSVGFTGGGAGLLIPLDLRPENFQFQDRTGFYYVILALTVAALVVVRLLEDSRLGAWMTAVRENEDSARALGVDATRVKLAAITLSGAMAASVGVFYGQYFLYLDPGIAYGVGFSVEALLVPIIGGMGTLFGPLLGALVLHGVDEAAKAATGAAPGLNLALYGVLLVVMLRFLPDGLMGLIARMARRARTPAAGPEPAGDA
ncbi:MAG: branched-chain amino acid ABC transporter permease [Inquilinaceae bacterium]